MIERGLLKVEPHDEDEEAEGAPTNDNSSTNEPCYSPPENHYKGHATASEEVPDHREDRQEEDHPMPEDIIMGSESKLNKLLTAPMINKVNYMDNYRMIGATSCSISSSSSSSLSAATTAVDSSAGYSVHTKSAPFHLNQKSVIQKANSAARRVPPVATITSAQFQASQGAASIQLTTTESSPNRNQNNNNNSNKTVVIINTSLLRQQQQEQQQQQQQQQMLNPDQISTIKLPDGSATTRIGSTASHTRKD